MVGLVFLTLIGLVNHAKDLGSVKDFYKDVNLDIISMLLILAYHGVASSALEDRIRRSPCSLSRREESWKNKSSIACLLACLCVRRVKRTLVKLSFLLLNGRWQEGCPPPPGGQRNVKKHFP